MGIKRNNRIKTTLYISDAPICKKCPARIYQKDTDVVTYGQGSIYPDIMIVLPKSALWNDKIHTYLKMVCEDLINLDEQYITYHPKCNADNLVQDYDKKCELYLLHEISKKQPKKIIFFGASIPEKLYSVDNIYFKIYKFKDLFSIHFGKDTITQFREQLKKIL